MLSEVSEDKVVLFRVGREEYAVTIAAVKEVVPWIEPTPIPETPPFVQGVATLRGQVTPVIDLGKLFRTERLKEGVDSKIIVMELGEQRAGFMVDEVTAVHAIAPNSTSAPSSVLRSAQQSAKSMIVSSILKLGENRLVMLVDPLRILASLGELDL